MNRSTTANGLAIRVGTLKPTHRVIGGAGEHTITADAIRAAPRRGARAAIAKSTDESLAAKDQPDRADRALLQRRWKSTPLPPTEHTGRHAFLSVRPPSARRRSVDHRTRDTRFTGTRERRLRGPKPDPQRPRTMYASAAQIEQTCPRAFEANIGVPHDAGHITRIVNHKRRAQWPRRRPLPARRVVALA